MSEIDAVIIAMGLAYGVFMGMAGYSLKSRAFWVGYAVYAGIGIPISLYW